MLMNRTFDANDQLTDPPIKVWLGASGIDRRQTAAVVQEGLTSCKLKHPSEPTV
jgi:hypothetical protein